MTKELHAIHRRSHRAHAEVADRVPTTRSGALVTKSERERISAWLKSRGDVTFSPWRRRDRR